MSEDTQIHINAFLVDVLPIIKIILTITFSNSYFSWWLMSHILDQLELNPLWAGSNIIVIFQHWFILAMWHKSLMPYDVTRGRFY